MSQFEIVGQDEVEVEEMDLVSDDLIEEPEAVEESPAEPEPGVDEEAEPEAPKERSTGFEWALEQIIEVNQAAIEQKARVKEAQAVLKDQKEELESIQDQLNRLIQEAAKLKTAGQPDPDKFPLFDRPKDEVNAALSTPGEFYRRKKQATRFDSLGLKPKVVEILAGAGYHTVLDLEKLGGVAITAIYSNAGSITEKRADEIRDALGAEAEKWVAEWNALHPAEAAGDVADPNDPDEQAREELGLNPEAKGVAE